MALQKVSIISELPFFTGNRRPNEPAFTPSIDARTFLRTLEAHFISINETDDNKKRNIFFSHIDKTRGDAAFFFNCYAGKPKAEATWEDIKRDFLTIYPAFGVTDLSQAAKMFLNSELTEKNMFCDMTQLEMAARAVAEAYLNAELINEGEFNAKTKIPPKAAGTSTSSETGSSKQPGITLLSPLHNFAMHIIIGARTHNKVYEKLGAFGPRKASTRFMAETVKLAEKRKLMATPKTRNDVREQVWKISTPKKAEAPRKSRNKDEASEDRKCFRCGTKGHLQKDCPLCAYCRAHGHSARNCERRKKACQGKYCSYCDIKDSHNTNECRKKAAGEKGTAIRMVQPAPGANDAAHDMWSAPYDSNVYESESSDNDGVTDQQY